MNPYYDQDWSVLPPENNRRYVSISPDRNTKEKKEKTPEKQFRYF